MKRNLQTIPKYRTAARGAAIIYALVAVLIIAILALGVGRLVSHHAYSENTAQGYARAIYLAEAAANWQISRMSRSNLPGAPNNIPGRLPWEAVNSWNETTSQYEPYNGPLPANELGVPVEGNVSVWVKSSALGGPWTGEFNPVLPNDVHAFYLYAVGIDPVTGIRRAIQLNGSATGLADRFTLFGQNEIQFQAYPPTPNSTGVATLKQGYIGSNGRVVSSIAGSPPISMPPPNGYFFGCRLGPNAQLSPPAGTWTAGWDIPRLPDPVQWPTIDQVVSYIWRGRSIATCATQNDNAQIQYRNADGTFSSFATPPTQLTNSEFSRSTSSPRTIRIKADLDAPNFNLIYLTNIRMEPTDVLLLDLRKKNQDDRATGIRILINNPNLADNEAPRITNLAYFYNADSVAAGDQKSQFPSYIWLNNTNQPLSYAPLMETQDLADPPASEAPSDTNKANYRYGVLPTLRGLVYGINSLSNTRAGDFNFEGMFALSLNAKINTVVANHINLYGKVTLLGEPVDNPIDPNRYVLYYRVTKRNYGEVNTNHTPTAPGTTTFRTPVYGYGSFP